jgi:hypothetical protein
LPLNRRAGASALSRFAWSAQVLAPQCVQAKKIKSSWLFKKLNHRGTEEKKQSPRYKEICYGNSPKMNNH